MGKHAETMNYQWQLHRNLMYLAQVRQARLVTVLAVEVLDTILGD